MRYLIIGIGLSIIGTITSLIVWGIDRAYLITGIIGVIFIGISMIYSGSMVSGDQMRANFATESVEGRRSRNKVMFGTALIALPNITVAILLYWFLNYR